MRRSAPAHTRRDTTELAAAIDAIRRIVQSLRVSARAAERRLGVSGAQLFVLHALAEAPAHSLNELAARTFTHQSSVSVVVDRLVRRRLVSRSRSADDGRRVVLSLTATGRSLLRSSPEVAQLRLISALRGLSVNECRTLARILTRVVRDMGATDVPALFFEDSAGARRPRQGAPAR
ncbi:MAG TPA: MarR family winged helix-turn-helix transcriptional regulator [Gemmatimonadaceae bacterium]